MTRPGTIFAIITVALLMITAGCTSPITNASTTANATPASAPTQSVALYKVTVAQPDAYSRFIRMDTDIYNAGEVVEFVVINDGNANLISPNDLPAFSVKFQTSHGSWATKMGSEKPAVSNATLLKHGESSQVYRFISDGWEAGRYRIVSDYGVVRDFLIKAGPEPALASVCPPAGNTTPWITIDPIARHYAGESFTISGTTNVEPGKELRYTIFVSGGGSKLVPLGTPVTITPAPGACGKNTWSADVMLPEPSDYFIGIAESTRTASALERFTILKAPSATSSGGVPATASVTGAPVPPTPQVSP
ncbi:hypothetical protein [Methanoregula sp.]|uniref:hypothetical protein n=1 Tax=Methanoregula sp. TaxID=2052170 RepID=UPI0035675A4A